jgi:hypothetical protein
VNLEHLALKWKKKDLENNGSIEILSNLNTYEVYYSYNVFIMDQGPFGGDASQSSTTCLLE